MAPGQNTFSIIPNAPGAINGDFDTAESRPGKRPMTSKQAKKAYQKATKGPKLSKAERRRQELFEQDRIRRELEKEKNQARAKAARDRKKEKEEKERAEKKKKGLPLVDVHPSQDTIAWFVRGNGRKQKKQESQEKQETLAVNLSAVNKDDSDSCTLSANEDGSEPPPKRQKIESPIPVKPDREHSPSATGVIDSSPSAVHDIDAGEAPPDIDDPVKRPSTPEHSNIDINDTETIEPLPDDLFDELINAANSSPPRKDIVPNKDISPSGDQKGPNSPSPSKQPENQSHSPIMKKELTPEWKTEDSASLPSTQLPLQTLRSHEINSRTINTPKEIPPSYRKPADPIDTSTVESPAEAASKAQRPVSATRSFRHPKTSMGPPPVPPKFRPRSHIQTQESRAPPFLLKHADSPSSHAAPNPNPKPAGGCVLQQTRQECSPTSTQLFMLGHLDDFFPSPSQEVRELFGEPNGCTVTNTSRANPRTAFQTHAPAAENSPTPSISTVSNLDRSASGVKNGKTIQEGDSPSLFTANIQSSGISELFDMPFFSTQDLILSSQDMRDLEDDTTSSLGSKHGEPSHQSKKVPEKHNSFLSKIPRGNTDSYSTTSMAPLPSKKSNPAKSSSRTKSTIDNGALNHCHQLPKPAKRLGTPNLVSKNIVSLETRIEKDSIYTPSFRNEVKPIVKGEGIPSAGSRYHENNTHHTLQKKDTGPPRRSPKPFFASSGREAHYKYAIERTKTTAWEGVSTRQKAQEELELLQRSEDERLERLLLESLREDGSIRALDTCASSSGSRPRDSTPRPHKQANGPSQPRSINQLSSSAGKCTQSQKVDEPKERRPRQNQSRSSYKEMLELLKQKENQRQEQKAVPASQETDYGDPGLDDVLSEML
ncbi:hypothetical protein M434DRAFT_393521 [Hypoxylon sp. CO27-5]|nr:hypothetical protein M434DRAFT_393521 [Hypoxylon sp. CO27-5]